MLWVNRHYVIGSPSIQGHPCQGVIDRNGQLSGSVIKCLHLSGSGREQGCRRLNLPAIDSSSSKRCISEEKLCFLRGGIELLGTVCALWGTISQDKCSAASQPPAPCIRWCRAYEQPLRALKGLGNGQENLPWLLLQPSVRLWPEGWCGCGCAMLKPSCHRCHSQPGGL